MQFVRRFQYNTAANNCVTKWGAKDNALLYCPIPGGGGCPGALSILGEFCVRFCSFFGLFLLVLGFLRIIYRGSLVGLASYLWGILRLL